MDWAPPQEGVVESAGIVPASSSGITVTAPGALNTKGAWSELIAATTREADGFHVEVRHNGGANGMSIDIGIGAAGSEVVLLPDYYTSIATSKGAYVPLRIPTGSRVAARYQRANAGDSVQVACHLITPSPHVGRKLAQALSLGFNAGTSLGTAVSGSGVANTKGSWVQFSAALPFDVKAVMLCVESSQGGGDFLLDLGVGAGGSEVVCVPDIMYPNSVNIETSDDFLIPIPIKAGQRFAVRAQCSGAANDDITLAMIVFG